MELQVIRIVLSIVIWMIGCSVAWNQDYYTAAVFEHTRQGENATDDPAAVLKSNLEYYKRATKIAKNQGADLILFPEYGLLPFLQRGEVKKYLEFVPNPKEVADANPCDQAELFADRQVLHALSCMAKRNGIVVVANMGSVEKCSNETGGGACPEDGDLQLNTNVAFDEEGTLIARYSKEHLFFEVSMDLPRERQDPIVRTRFGKFATFICFDIIFERMTLTSRMQDVDAVLFSTMWWNTSPFYLSTQWFQAWARGNNATIIAANVQWPGHFSTGSGVFRGGETDSVALTLNPDGVPKLVVARIPRRRDEAITKASVTALSKNGVVEKWKGDYKDVPEVCSYAVLGATKDVLHDYRCVNEKVENYTLVRLEQARDRLKACHNGMCCVLDYEANAMNESYYLGVYNGTNSPFTTGRYFWWEENCFLARCDDFNGTECANFPLASHGTLFRRISMAASSSTEHVYPSLVGNRMELVPAGMWTFNKSPDSSWSSITMVSEEGIPVIAAALKGRPYEKDPPYIR